MNAGQQASLAPSSIEPAPERPRWHGCAAIALTALSVVPALVAVIAYAGAHFLPGGDIAIIDVRTRDVFSSNIPLVGAYSRYGWNHPGPTMYYLMAPLNAIAGGAAWSTLAAAAILHIAAIVLTMRLAWRRGGLGLVVLVAAAVSLAYSAIGVRVFLDFWNPHIAFPFLALFVLQVWSISLGDRWQLVGATIVGTFLVQTHVGYAPLVAVALSWAVVILFFDHRRSPISLGPWRRVVGVSVAALVVLWIPPLVQELTGHPGNLTLLARFARDGAGRGAGLRTGAGLFAAEFRLLPPWLGGHEHLEPLTLAAQPASLWWLLVPAVLLAVGAVAARRTASKPATRLIALVAVLAVTSVVALARVEPPLNTYLFHWRVIVAVFVMVAAGWALAGTKLARRNRIVPMAAAAVVALGSVWAGGSLAWDLAGQPRVNRFEPETRSLLHQLSASGIPDRPFVVRNAGSGSRGVAGAIMDELDRRGAPLRVDPAFAFVWGDDRTIKPDRASAIWYVAEEGKDVSLLTAVPGARVLARTTPLSPSDEAQLVRLQRTLTAQLVRAGRTDLVPILEYSVLISALDDVAGVDHAAVGRVEKLEAKVERTGACRCAVIAFLPKNAPSPGGWVPTR